MASNSFVSSASISELVYAFPLVVSAVHSVKCALYRLFTLCIVLREREREREREKERERERERRGGGRVPIMLKLNILDAH